MLSSRYNFTITKEIRISGSIVIQFVRSSPKKRKKLRALKKIYNIAVRGTTRGGAFEDDIPFLSEEDLLYGTNAINNFITFLLHRIVQRLRTIDNLVVRVILWSLRSYIMAILKEQGIFLFFCEDELTGRTMIIAMVSSSLSGSTLVYITAWFGVSMTMLSHYGFALLIGRSVVQYFGYKLAVRKREKEIRALTEKYNELLKQHEQSLLLEEKYLKEIDRRLKMNDWQKSSSMKIVEQQLGISNKKKLDFLSLRIMIFIYRYREKLTKLKKLAEISEDSSIVSNNGESVSDLRKICIKIEDQ